MLDGQQRITSIGRYITNKFAVRDENGLEQYFSGLAENLKSKILNTSLLIYECQGTESEIKEWFKTINIAGVPLNNQEILNAVHSGPFVTAAKAEFSNSNKPLLQKWQAYIKGDVKRQYVLETALNWVSKGNVDKYMSKHRQDKSIDELKNYFTSVIDWVSSVFNDVEKEMKGQPWGEYYEEYHNCSYNPSTISQKVHELYGDEYVKNRKGIFEYLLGGEKKTQLLSIRIFDDATKKSVYLKQTDDAKKRRVSNCPYCEIGHDANKTRIWKFNEMDADHVSAWSKGGKTSIENCQMLCRSHNRSKGNN